MGVPYLECSSKTGENVAEVFHILMKEIEKDDGLLNESEENGCSILSWRPMHKCAWKIKLATRGFSVHTVPRA